MRAITRTGKANVSRRTRSARPSGANESISSSTTRRTRSCFHRASSFGRNAGATSARWARCSGSSIAIIVWSSIGPMISARIRRRVRLVVAQHGHRLVVAEHVERRLGGRPFGALVDRHHVVRERPLRQHRALADARPPDTGTDRRCRRVGSCRAARTGRTARDPVPATLWSIRFQSVGCIPMSM